MKQYTEKEIQNIDEVVKKNNERLLPTKKSWVNKITDMNTGAVIGESKYYLKEWQIVREAGRGGRTNTAIQTKLVAAHGKGSSFTIKRNLSLSQTEYLIDKLGIIKDGQKLNCKTKLGYGFKKDGSPYVHYGFKLGDYYIGELLNTYLVDIVMDKMLSEATMYDEVFERSYPGSKELESLNLYDDEDTVDIE